MNELEKNVINDYPLLGAKQCSIKYNTSYNKIYWIKIKYNLILNENIRIQIKKNAINLRKIIQDKKNIKHLVDENVFMNKFIKESVYLLGFIWGDGYILNTGKNNQIRIECITEDINQLKPIFKKTGVWKYYKRLRINKKREVTIALTSNKNLVEFLIQNDYKNKSKTTPEKIWNLIPDEYKKYFILGWIDADGCFYWNEKNCCRQFYISGSYEQNWSVFENLLISLNANYKIIRINKKTKYSYIRITDKLSINKIGKYIYDDIIPFQRKFEKYKLIIA
jgi:hypothetical protein